MQEGVECDRILDSFHRECSNFGTRKKTKIDALNGGRNRLGDIHDCCGADPFAGSAGELRKVQSSLFDIIGFLSFARDV